MTGPSDDALSTILMDTVLDSASSVRLAREGSSVKQCIWFCLIAARMKTSLDR